MLSWLDHRAGLRKLVGMMLLEGIPGGARWRYVWGSCLAFVFSLQLITGVMLMTAYSPSESQAWSSVHYIQYKMDFGWMIRGLHHFGSQTMMVLIGLHMLQVVIAGAHLPPREVNWWLGIGLLSVTLGLSLTGYLLPWDQKGYWATDVATNIAGSLPGMGDDIKRQAVGGPDSGNHTLTRFYALHVAILPGSLILLLVAHIAIFRRQGVTCKANVEGLVTKPENEHAPGSETFWPRQAFYDLIACMLVFSFMFGLVLYGFAHPVEPPPGAPEPGLYDKIARAGVYGKGAELDAAADRNTANYPARPEWYFLGLFQLLKYFKGEQAIYGTVVIPNGAMLLLALLPFFGMGPLRKFGHFFGILVMVSLLTAVGLLTLKALDDDSPQGILWGVLKDKNDQDSVEKAEKFVHSRHEAEILGARACQLAMEGSPVEGGHFLIRNDPFITGQELFKTHCAGCHNFTAQERDKDKFKSMTTGSKASDLGDFASEAWIRGLLENPMDKKYFGNVLIPEKDENGMPIMKDGKPKLTHGLTGMKDFLEEMDEKDRKFDDAIKWLAEQRKPAGMRDKDIATGPGQKAFFEGDHRCSGCHKAEFTEKKDKTLTFTKKGGASAPDLSGYGSEEWIRGMIMSPGHKSRHKTNFMPAFRDLDGPNAAVNIQEARELNKDTSISHLTDVERELIIRWMLRDYRPVFGGAAIAK